MATRLWVTLLLSSLGCATAVDATTTEDTPTSDGGPASCSNGRSVCDGVCVDTSKDTHNCGACGTACNSAMTCSHGTCIATSCPSGLTNCGKNGLACVDTQSSADNCGACGNACGASEACSMGACVIQCPQGQTMCNSMCVDTTSDDANCGACGNACSAPATCMSGKCTCPQNLVTCNGACVDTTSDNANCGACGTACGGSDQCVSGKCATPPSQIIVFASSVVYAAGNLGGLAGADSKCQSLAQSASLSGTFKAWLSDSNTDASSRFPHWNTPYKLPNGTMVASNWSGLVSGKLAHAIDRTESSNTPANGTLGAGAVWTNTKTDGTKLSTNPCGDWTKTSGTVSNFRPGWSARSDAGWTADPNSTYNGSYCASTANIYCVQN